MDNEKLFNYLCYIVGYIAAGITPSALEAKLTNQQPRSVRVEFQDDIFTKGQLKDTILSTHKDVHSPRVAFYNQLPPIFSIDKSGMYKDRVPFIEMAGNMFFLPGHVLNDFSHGLFLEHTFYQWQPSAIEQYFNKVVNKGELFPQNARASMIPTTIKDSQGNLKKEERFHVSNDDFGVYAEAKQVSDPTKSARTMYRFLSAFNTDSTIVNHINAMRQQHQGAPDIEKNLASKVKFHRKV